MGFDKLPRFYSINGRPLKFVETADGGMDVLAWDAHSNEFVRQLQYISGVFKPGADVEELTEAEFDALVAQERSRTSEHR